MSHGWKTRSSKVVYKNQYITVKEDAVIRPDGSNGIYGYLQVPRTVGIVPMDQNYQIYLCKQPRYIFRGDSWEIPRGFVDTGETLEEAAKRELEEEAGLVTNQLTRIGVLRPSMGLMDEETVVFLAQELNFAKHFKIQENEIEEIKIFPFRRVIQMIEDGKILDGLTIPAVLLAKQYLKL